MPSIVDNVMVDPPPPSGTLLRMRQNAGERFYRYICMGDWFEETPDGDSLSTFGIPSPSISGASGVLQGVSLIDDNFVKQGDPGVGPLTMYVFGNYNSNTKGREQKYTILLTSLQGEIRELVVDLSIL